MCVVSVIKGYVGGVIVFVICDARGGVVGSIFIGDVAGVVRVWDFCYVIVGLVLLVYVY